MQKNHCTPLTESLDPGFVSAALWTKDYLDDCASNKASIPFAIALENPDGSVSRWDTTILPWEPDHTGRTIKHIERSLKFLLWQRGGQKVHLGGSPEVAKIISQIYSPDGERAFDVDFVGRRVFGANHEFITHTDADDVPAEKENSMSIGRHLDGCRIGFDLGGSDRKCAAVIDGKVVHSEEVVWDPYFQSDPDYHLDGIRDSLKRAAAHLPHVDAIGGSAAGVYLDNQVRTASLFRGIPEELFESRVRNIFLDVQKEWDVPMIVINDGDVTALAGSMSLKANNVLGIAMGTSEAVGYVNHRGEICGWLNELAFCPVDYQDNAPTDEWAGDAGCGVQYFSQQAVSRLAPAAGFDFSSEMPFAERLIKVQEKATAGDRGAERIYETIGGYLAYSLAHYATFYEIDHVLLLGRVTSGTGGNRLIETARTILKSRLPETDEQLAIHVPGEKEKRHGQAVAAASLPQIK